MATRQEILEARSRRQTNPVLGNFIPLGSHQQDTSISAATVISASESDTTHILLNNSDSSVDVRYTLDGTTPTTTLGFLLEPKADVIIPVRGVTLTVIETAAGGQVDWQEVIGAA